MAEEKVFRDAIVVAGMRHGELFWKKVGVFTTSKKGLPVLLLDKTFNPAGVITEYNEMSIAIYSMEQKVWDDSKKSYTVKPPTGIQPSKDVAYDDDIPF